MFLTFLLLFVCFLPGIGWSAVLTFDDLDLTANGGNGKWHQINLIDSDYGGFTWDKWGVADPYDNLYEDNDGSAGNAEKTGDKPKPADQFDGSGYAEISSGSTDQVAFNWSRSITTINGDKFNFNGAEFIAGWKSGVSLTITGLSENQIIAEAVLVLAKNAITSYDANGLFNGIDTLEFTSLRYNDKNQEWKNEWFVMDDFDTSIVAVSSERSRH